MTQAPAPLVLSSPRHVEMLVGELVANRHRARPALRPSDFAVAEIGDIDDPAVPALLAARELLVVACGAGDAGALQAMLEGEQTPGRPVSMLRDHTRLTVVCDEAAAARLTPRPGRDSDQVVIVLGHREPGVSAEDRISDESRARLWRASRYCAARSPRAVIFTGWSRTPGGESEAEQMKAYWDEPDVPALLEDAGRNTAENATCSLPLVRAMGDVRRVAVVTSVWHIRTPYFFAPYRALGLHVSFVPEVSGPWARMLWHEIGAMRYVRRQRRAAMRGMRLPAELRG